MPLLSFKMGNISDFDVQVFKALKYFKDETPTSFAGLGTSYCSSRQFFFFFFFNKAISEMFDVLHIPQVDAISRWNGLSSYYYD